MTASTGRQAPLASRKPGKQVKVLLPPTTIPEEPRESFWGSDTQRKKKRSEHELALPSRWVWLWEIKRNKKPERKS